MIGELVALIGAVLVLLSAVGVDRFRDTLARLHALAKASTLGVLLLLGGAAANVPDVNARTSVLLAALLHLLASPPASNMVSQAVYLAAGRPAGAIDERSPIGPDPTVGAEPGEAPTDDAGPAAASEPS